MIALLLFCSGAACDVQECISDPMDFVLDPQTGGCIEVSNRDGCMYCSTEGHRCVIADVHDLDYADCRGTCLAVTEAGCLATDGCRAAYEDARFIACWGTAPSGPVHTGVCIGLDAHECSRHDNCTSWFAPAADGGMVFDHCEAEPPSV